MPERSKQHPDWNHAQEPFRVSQRNALLVWTHGSYLSPFSKPLMTPLTDPPKTPSPNNNKGPRQALQWDSRGWILMPYAPQTHTHSHTHLHAHRRRALLNKRALSSKSVTTLRVQDAEPDQQSRHKYRTKHSGARTLNSRPRLVMFWSESKHQLHWFL